MRPQRPGLPFTRPLDTDLAYSDPNIGTLEMAANQAPGRAPLICSGPAKSPDLAICLWSLQTSELAATQGPPRVPWSQVYRPGSLT